MPMVLDILDLCYQALKEGGRLIVMTPNGESPIFGRIRYGDITHCCAFTTTSMAHLFRVCGFNVFRFKPYESRPIQISLFRKFYTSQGCRILKRQIAWNLTKRFYRFIISAEAGKCDPILTFNLIACAVKGEKSEAVLPPPGPGKKAFVSQQKKN